MRMRATLAQLIIFMESRVQVSDSSDEILLDCILDSLEDMGCKGPLMKEGALMTAVQAGITSQPFTSLVLSLCAELKQAHSLQEAVTPPQPQGWAGAGDIECFQLELHGVLKELHCPHVSLTGGVAMLSTSHQCLLLLDYLVSEVMTSRLVLTQQDEDAAMDTTTGGQSHTIAANLAAILKVYNFSRPPPNVTIIQVYEKIIGKTRSLLQETSLDVGLVTQMLSDGQWEVMEEINKSLTQEYATRRQMMLTRCDVTIQSFGWSEKVKGGEDQISKAYRGRREGLNVTAPVSMARVLAAKDDLLRIRKTNDPSLRSHTQCSINKILIHGKVPDRGGRPRETRPPPEMPAFKKRMEAPRDQWQKGGGEKGGRVQGGWSGGKGGGGGGGGGGKKSGGKGGWGQGSHDGYQGYQGGKSKQYHS